MGVTLRYTALRLGIFAVCLVVAGALGAKTWLALAIAAVASVLLSLVLLRKQREQMAAALQQRIDGRLAEQRDGTAKKSRFARGLDEDNAAED
jgi:membrane protein implicated in regulation of membrane protease activity